MLCGRVQLPNGAYLVIQETEALVSIDVNGGTGMLGKNMKSDAILEVNLAAARQVDNYIVQGYFKFRSLELIIFWCICRSQLR